MEYDDYGPYEDMDADYSGDESPLSPSGEGEYWSDHDSQ